MTREFVTALVGETFGLEGFVKTKSLSGETSQLLALKEARLRKNGRETVYQIEKAVPSGDAVLIKFTGIDSPEAARLLKGAEMLVSREGAAPLGPSEFYVEDLKGLDVIFEGRKVGLISNVIEGGGGDLVEAELPSGEKRLIPLRREFFGLINPEGGQAELLADWFLK